MAEGTLAPPQAPPATPDRPRGRWRGEAGRLLEVVALVGLVVTQPLLDVLGRSPDFFLFHRASRADVLLLVALIAIAPTVPFALLGALGLIAGRLARAAVHTLVVGLLLAALAVQVGRHLTPLRGVPLLLVAGATGAAAAAAHRRWRAPGRVLRVAAVGPLVFVGLFVFASPASAVVLPKGHGGAAGVAGAGAHPPV
ncbi:sulfatase-like hydrolase/transferase, partial [Micromonospora chersina]